MACMQEDRQTDRQTGCWPLCWPPPLHPHTTCAPAHISTPLPRLPTTHSLPFNTPPTHTYTTQQTANNTQPTNRRLTSWSLETLGLRCMRRCTGPRTAGAAACATACSLSTARSICSTRPTQTSPSDRLLMVPAAQVSVCVCASVVCTKCRRVDTCDSG